MDFRQEAKLYRDPEKMAAAYLASHFGNSKIEYPINPFALLQEEGILFNLADFKKLEGVYIPASSDDDIPTVGINGNRPITRQRFTAAHELCHHFKDADRQITCPITGTKNAIELFADKFAAAILMPLAELRIQVNKRKNIRNTISLDDVLEIADYFGVSFESCLFRIAYLIHAIEGDTESSALKKRAKKYGPDKVRKARHMTYTKLLSGLIDCYSEQLAFTPSEHAWFMFQNEYIYNDSRMEGVDVSEEEAAEIVTDLRLNMQNSEYCKEENEAFLSVAGHYEMYLDILALPVKESLSIYDMLPLNRKLFSHYPCPEFGGSIRQNNTLVIGGKFETVDYHDIYSELAKLDAEIREFFPKRHEMAASEYIKHVARIHHRITVVHPFSDGNGRTSRAFMNIQLVRAGLPPVFIKVEDKGDYTSALARADSTGDYEELYEIVLRAILQSHIALCAQ